MEIKINQLGELLLTIPSDNPSIRTSTIHVPCSLEGLKVIRQILLADRAVRSTGQKPRFLTEAAPTQAMVEEYLKTHTPKQQVKKQKTNIHVDLSTLDLNF